MRSGVCPLCLLEIGLETSERDHTAVRTPNRRGSSIAGVEEPDEETRRALTPGSILGNRFRLIAHIGSGGMGDVYRADDLKLGQSVALKFIAPVTETDRSSLRRLYSEVRLARQVAHPNVCRVYDVVELEGRHCIVMEFIDGEDLASLLLRVGRISPERALNVGRELCAGLAASHRAGIIHGDLKPSNVMIDGRGSARIMDFGLSRMAGDVEVGMIAGTVAYMAPEQLDGRSATASSDLYAFGLILWELYAGRPARKGESLSAVRTEARQTPLLSSVLPDVDPAVEEIIAGCMQPDPANRPASAARILSLFPGGGLLEAAVAAGETPSPELVAADQVHEHVSPRVAGGILTMTAILFLILLTVSERLGGSRDAAMLIHPPEVLAKKAASFAENLAPPLPAEDAVWRFALDRESAGVSPRDPAAAAVSLRYRQSARQLVPSSADGKVSLLTPPEPGMVDVTVDVTGRLRALEAAAFRGRAVREEPVRWEDLFSAAGLEASRFSRAEPAVAPRVPHERALAWKADDGTLRVEAATLDGSIVSFRVVEGVAPPETRDFEVPPIASGTYLGLVLVMLFAGGYLARTNARLGRVDSRGSFRVSASVFVCWMLWWVFAADHVRSFEGEVRMAADALGVALFAAARVWLGYAALEPFVRRRSPRRIVSWNRLVRGRFRDSRVGRDLLLGTAAGMAVRLLDETRSALSGAMFGVARPADARLLEGLSSTADATGLLFFFQTRAVFHGLFALFFLLLLEWALRNGTLARIAWVAALTLVGTEWQEPLLDGAIAVVQLVLLLVALERFGLLTLVSALYVRLVLAAAPITADVASWQFGREALLVGVVAALALWAFRHAVGEQSPFSLSLIQGKRL